MHTNTIKKHSNVFVRGLLVANARWIASIKVKWMHWYASTYTNNKLLLSTWNECMDMQAHTQQTWQQLCTFCSSFWRCLQLCLGFWCSLKKHCAIENIDTKQMYNTKHMYKHKTNIQACTNTYAEHSETTHILKGQQSSWASGPASEPWQTRRTSCRDMGQKYKIET